MLSVLSAVIVFPLDPIAIRPNITFKDVPKLYYIYGGVWLALSLIGMIIQLIYKRKDSDDEDNDIWKDSKRNKKDEALWKDDFRNM